MSNYINHTAKFGNHRDFGRDDIISSICHMTLPNHVLKESCEFMGANSLLYIIILSRLLVIDILAVKI